MAMTMTIERVMQYAPDSSGSINSASQSSPIVG
jgi:hypothetical protein